jgi:DNA-binding transcriptional MerR regulator
MANTRYYLPKDIGNELHVSPSTLRRWSDEFADFLSELAGRPHIATDGQATHRRYTDQDLETLRAIKGLLAEGLTYMQVGKRLELLRQRQAAADAESGERSQVTVLGPSAMDSSSVNPGFSLLANTLNTVADGQQLLIGSQQANRELLSVMIQDNFSLKEENAKLRERMLDLERDLSEMRRTGESRSGALELRLQRIEERFRRGTSKANKAKRAERSGCLAQLFGPL